MFTIHIIIPTQYQLFYLQAFFTHAYAHKNASLKNHEYYTLSKN